MLVLFPISSYGIPGPFELLAISAISFSPIAIIRICVLCALLHFRKRFSVFGVIILIPCLFILFSSPSLRYKLFTGPLKIDELKNILNLLIIKSNNIHVKESFEEGDIDSFGCVFAYSPRDDRVWELKGNHIVKDVIQDFSCKTALAVDTNPARSLNLAILLSREIPSISYFVSRETINTVGYIDLKEIKHQVVHKKRVLPDLARYVVYLIATLAVTLLLSRLVILAFTIKLYRSDGTTIFALRVLEILVVTFVLKISPFSLNLKTATEVMDFSLLLTDMFFLKSGIILWEYIIPHILLLLGFYIYFHMRINMPLNRAIETSFQASSTPHGGSFLRPIALTIIFYFSSIYFRVTHNLALFISIILISGTMVEVLLVLGLRIVKRNINFKIYLVSLLLGIRKKGTLYSKTNLLTYSSKPLCFQCKGGPLHILDFPESEQIILEKAWKFVFLCRMHAAFVTDGKNLMLSSAIVPSDVISSMDEQVSFDFLTQIHPRWRRDIELDFLMYESTSKDLPPISRDIVKSRWQESGCDFLALKSVFGYMSSQLDSNPIILIGERIVLYKSKYHKLIQGSRLLKWVREYYTSLFFAEFRRLLSLKHYPNYYKKIQSKLSKIEKNILNISQGTKNVEYINIIKELFSLVAGREQKNLSILNFYLTYCERELCKLHENSTEHYSTVYNPNIFVSYEHNHLALREILHRTKPTMSDLDLLKSNFQNIFVNAQISLAKILEIFGKKTGLDDLIFYLTVDEIFSIDPRNLKSLHSFAMTRKFNPERSHNDSYNLSQTHKNIKTEAIFPAQEIMVSNFYFTRHGFCVNSVSQFLRSKMPVIYYSSNITPKEIELIEDTSAIVLKYGTFYSHASMTARHLSLAMLINYPKTLLPNSYLIFDRHGKEFIPPPTMMIESYQTFLNSKSHFKSIKAFRCAQVAMSLRVAHSPFGFILPGRILSTCYDNVDTLDLISKEICSSFPQSVRSVILRSAAYGEDMDLNSIGRYKSIVSFLNNNDIALALEAIERDYNEKGVQGDIIIQEYIESELAGILVTRDNSMSLESEKLISLECALGKSSNITSGSNFTLIAQIDMLGKIYNSIGDLNLLDHFLIQKIIRLVEGIEELFTQPQEVEWCFLRGKIVFLQTRDIGNEHELSIPLEI